MKQMDSQKDYLKDLPMPKLPKIDSEEIQAEITRVLGQKGKKENEAPSLDVPEPEKSNTQAWKNAYDVARRNNEVAEMQKLNLELESKDGGKVWQQSMVDEEMMIDQVRRQKELVQKEINEINRKRKFSQTNQAQKIMALQGSVDAYHTKNIDLECQIASMEAQYR